MEYSQAYREYLLRIADTSLIYGQRLAEWCGHGPVLEEDIALTNTALDYLGQATLVFRHLAESDAEGRNEDQIAFLRDAWQYRNLIITELPNGDYAFTIARQFLFTSWYYIFLQKLQTSSDEFLSGFAAKSIKEVRYHWQHSSDWVKRMGDGTEESHHRIVEAFKQLWAHIGEFFEMDDVDRAMLDARAGVDAAALKNEWKTLVHAVMEEATVPIPDEVWTHSGSKAGKHTEYLGYILADMQFLQRAYPGSKW